MGDSSETRPDGARKIEAWHEVRFDRCEAGAGRFRQKARLPWLFSAHLIMNTIRA